MGIKYKWLPVLFPILCLLIFPHNSFAKDAAVHGVEIYPAFVDVTLGAPEHEKRIQFTFVNHTSKDLSFDIFPIDFKQRTDLGDIGFLGQDSGSYSYSLSSFLSFESNKLSLAAGEKRNFLMTVKNRDDLSPGGHYAALVARLVNGNEGTMTTVQPSLSSLILLHKTGGERFNLSLVDIDMPHTVFFAQPKVLQLIFQNEGNIHLVPYGTIEVRDSFSRLIEKGIINTSSFRVMPETRRIIPVDMMNQQIMLPISLNTVTVKGQDSLHKVTFLHREVFISIHPAVPFVLVGLAMLLLILSRKRKHKKTV